MYFFIYESDWNRSHPDVCQIFRIFDMINEYAAMQHVRKLILNSACVQYKNVFFFKLIKTPCFNHVLQTDSVALQTNLSILWETPLLWCSCLHWDFPSEWFEAWQMVDLEDAHLGMLHMDWTGSLELRFGWKMIYTVFLYSGALLLGVKYICNDFVGEQQWSWFSFLGFIYLAVGFKNSWY